jgi:hypothetical protein
VSINLIEPYMAIGQCISKMRRDESSTLCEPKQGSRFNIVDLFS